MRKRIKAWLYEAGLFDAAQHLYYNLRTASPSVVLREVPYRRSAPDGYPTPPARLIFAIIACRWAAVYFDSGRRIVDDMARVLKDAGCPLPGFSSILDFGCGCGRLLRQVHTHTDAALHGSDLNPDLIRWCQDHLPFAAFTTNDLEPPLPVAAEQFDYAYARSVFTHLPEALQHAWIDELHRVLQPGGYLYLTMHGRPMLHGLSDDQRATFEAGDLVVAYPTAAGDNLCSTFASRAYVERELLRGFALAAFIEGRDDPHLRQDIYLLRKHEP